MDDAQRHLALLTRTTEVVNTSLDLQEVLEAIAHEVAAALETDACFVYLYDERADELVLRATHGTPMEVATSAPRMRRGDGITGVAAAERTPIMIPSGAHLDPRFKAFPNLREEEYESILAVPILARDVLEGALNVRTRTPRAFTEAEIALLTSIASQVGQSIEHAKLYAQAQRRVHELEALAHISEAVSESLYLEESLEAIVSSTVASLPSRRRVMETAAPPCSSAFESSSENTSASAVAWCPASWTGSRSALTRVPATRLWTRIARSRSTSSARSTRSSRCTRC